MESNPVAVDGVLYTTNAPLGAGVRDRRGDRTHIWEYPLVRRRDAAQRDGLHPRRRRPAPGRRGRRGPGLQRPPGRPPRRARPDRPAARSGRPPSARTRTTRRSPAPRSTSAAWSSSVTARATAAATARRCRPSGPRTAPASGAGARSRGPDSPGTRPGRTTARAATAARSTVAARSGSPRSSTRTRGELIVGTGNPEPWNSRGPGHEPLHRLDRRARPLHGPAEVVLPAGPPRPVGLRPAEQRRHVRRQVQGRTARWSRVPPLPTSTRSA